MHEKTKTSVLIIKGENLYLTDLISYTFDAGVHVNTGKPISFKRDKVIGTAKSYGLISSMMTLTFSQGGGVRESQNLYASFEKMHEVEHALAIGDEIRETTAKKSCKVL